MEILGIFRMLGVFLLYFLGCVVGHYDFDCRFCQGCQKYDLNGMWAYDDLKRLHRFLDILLHFVWSLGSLKCTIFTRI